jgi:protein-L-isoaspartate O-methyltransferase
MAPFFDTRDYNRGISQHEFHYHRCPSCGLVSLINVPADLERYYSAGYHLLPSSEQVIERSLLHEHYKIELVQRYVKSGRLLEIGPAWGAFCLLAKRAGFTVEAIEMDRDCCTFLTTKLGIRAIHSTDECAALDEVSPPDVIAMWHVIEHLRDPWTLLTRAAERLAPGGIMIVATPNTEARQFGIFGRRWTHVDAPRHIHLIPAALLRAKLDKFGLEELLVTTTDPGSLGWNRFGWSFSLANFTSFAVLRRLLRVIGHVPALLFSPIERLEGKGSAYTAVFRKPVANR